MKLARIGVSSIAVAAVGCAAVAGFEPLTFEPDTVALDGSADADTSDSAPLAEGGPDANITDAGPDSRAPIGCAADPGHDFCDDFSDTLVFDAGAWTNHPIVGTGPTFTRDQEAMLSVLPPADSGTVGSNFLEVVRPWMKLGSGLRPRIVFRARLLVEECPRWSNFIRVFQCAADVPYCGAIQVMADRGECWSKLIWTDNRDAGNLGYHHLLQPTAIGEWHDVAVIIEESANGSTTLTYEIDGIRSGAVVDATNETGELLVGIGVEGPEMGGRYRIDDVRADYTE